MDEKAEIRERILHAAMERIKHYGYAKTTMAEIASDCCMSAGNIYRFFESKADIAEGMARHHYAHQQQDLAAVSRRADMPVADRLKEIFFRRMRENYQLVQDNAKILEVAEVMHRERPLFMNEVLAQERIYIGALIEEGIRQGVFRPCDPMFTAEMLQAATAKFGFPQLFSQLTLPKLERELEGVFELLLNGLYAQPSQASEQRAADASAQPVDA